MIDIIATISSSLVDKIDEFAEKGASIFRINGAHTTASTASQLILEIREKRGNDARILIDLPTNKIRTKDLDEIIVLNPEGTFRLHEDQLNLPELYKRVKVGDRIFVNEGQNILTVIDMNSNLIILQSDSDGYLGNNRGLVFERKIHTPEFPLFFDKDFQLIEVINDMKVDLVGISYVRYPSDKETAQKHIVSKDSIIYKVETHEARNNYKSLLQPGETILIDRGDLAADIGLINTPQAQEEIIHFAHQNNIKVYIATQFLISMMDNNVPSISDVYTLFYTFKEGVQGIQLSEETAIGKHPVKTIEWVRSAEHLFAKFSS